ncbi:MAG: hypothetical protein HC876_09115 [Chloroflexaceae bacterium]|nr:hypothetical protein [Chloroflexaceae bacterium]NJO05661.1 hypothetical protein [Chloroflexaceae bacterium]
MHSQQKATGMAPLDRDIVAFQAEVEHTLRPLHMREAAPSVAARQRGFAQFACLGPIVLVGIGFLAVLVFLPLASIVIDQGYGLILAIVLPPILLLTARWLGRINAQNQQQEVYRYQQMIDELIALEPDEPHWTETRERLQQQTRLGAAEREQLDREWEAAHARYAAALLERQDVLVVICPVLRTDTRDVFTIARRLSGALHQAVQQGTLPIPLFPMLVATMSMQVIRRGVGNVCGMLNGQRPLAAQSAEQQAPMREPGE